MNSRGALPQPDSRRGLNGTNGAVAEFVQEPVEAPRWLARKMRADFDQLIAQQHKAGVGTRSVDAEMYAQYILLLYDFRGADNAEDRQKARRVMAGLEDALVIGEKARQRVGIRGKTVQPKSKLGAMLVMKNGTTGGND